MFLTAVVVLCATAAMSEEDVTSLTNGCRDLEDGLQWIQPVESDADDVTAHPPLRVQCSNDYAILDIARDPAVKNYLSSFDMWHRELGGPGLVDHCSWEDWWTPPGEWKFLVSPDCNSCDRATVENEHTYYMTGHLYGCLWDRELTHENDWDPVTYECPEDFNVCGVMPMNADEQPKTGHWDCLTDRMQVNFRPSIGTEGRFCVCVFPAEPMEFDVLLSTLAMRSEGLNVAHDEETEAAQENNIVHLSQEDFEHGTYRILEPGTYLITEDIVFNFNGPDTLDDPNAVYEDDEGTFHNEWWWPTEEQMSAYPGAHDYRGHYFMGFFAGITVETSGVTIDLGGHELRMSTAFFFQQPFFSLITLGAQPFGTGFGIGFFGEDMMGASDVTVQNGVLGLTNHHGIHGNDNSGVVLQDLVIKEFGTHGIQLNGFDGAIIQRCDIGDSTDKLFLSGEYSHARFGLSRFHTAHSMYPDAEVVLRQAEGPFDVEKHLALLEHWMDLALRYALLLADSPTEATEWDEANAGNHMWAAANQLFINRKVDQRTGEKRGPPIGLPFGSQLTGILLAYPNNNVLAYRMDYKHKSYNVLVEDVVVHDLQHRMQEYVALQHNTKSPQRGMFNGQYGIWNIISDPSSVMTSHYTGTTFVDLMLVTNEILNDDEDWAILQRLQTADKWFQDGNFQNTYFPFCNSDTMSHSGKGIIGIRIDGVNDVVVKNVEMRNLRSSGELGSELCGPYSSKDAENPMTPGGHDLQAEPMQTGYSGNMLQGVSIDYSSGKIVFDGLRMSDFESETGQVYGLSVWPGVDATVAPGGVTMSNFAAGTAVEPGTLQWASLPNQAPEVCGVRVYEKWLDYAFDGNTVYSSLSVQGDISATEFFGHAHCFGEDGVLDLGVGVGITSEFTVTLKGPSGPLSVLFFPMFLAGVVIALAFGVFWKHRLTKQRSAPNVDSEENDMLLPQAGGRSRY